ncbi:hypothetical protein A2935_04090 [Candidatus Wolfebacteria bacterium RIFCSPLOWO2_01_FULL_47_17b]|uniref:cysteine desulfurase n=1 Tax=Candidatus Wolfebacteria bacterium RIFCSPLOWO2_01_FULL_47_17b TaxID=1802558 RepID=A0A1F8E0E4_9BACT|nr:MAG: hypothetical protein A2935_04090 [Candidatus Wolfebacteria bacterium RIFCSPLOWO2_01_FULL_47_17b]
MLDVKKIKENFPIFDSYRERYGKELVYLDSAASSQTPRQVVEAMNEYYFNYRSNVHRSPYALGTAATSAYENARTTVAKFIGAEKWEIIFTPGATFGVNMLVLMLEKYLKLGQKDEITISVAEHHSNFIPFQELAKRSGAVVRLIPLKGTDLDYDIAKKLIWRGTKIVTLPLASNVLGTLYDIRRIVQWARQAGAITIVDATTAIGHIGVDVRSLGCDFLFFSGHKMLGPTGIGVLYGREELLTRLYPSFFGGGIVESVTEKETTYLDIPECFEPGTPNIAGAIGLARAIEYVHSLGMGTVTEHVQELVHYTIKKLDAIPYLTVLSEKNEKKNSGVVSFSVLGIGSQRLTKALDHEHISIRGGHHCAMPLVNRLGVSGVCRASFYVYNDQTDINTLVSGIKKARELLK